MTYTPDELKEIVRYYDDEIKRIVEQIKLLPVKKAKNLIRFYEQRGYRIDWEETCFTHENGVKVLHPDYFIAIFSIEHKLTTCARLGHRDQVMSAEADGTMVIECNYCGYKEEIEG